MAFEIKKPVPGGDKASRFAAMREAAIAAAKASPPPPPSPLAYGGGGGGPTGCKVDSPEGFRRRGGLPRSAFGLPPPPPKGWITASLRLPLLRRLRRRGGPPAPAAGYGKEFLREGIRLEGVEPTKSKTATS